MRNWGYYASLICFHYSGYTIESCRRLTFKQVDLLMKNLRYVMPDSKWFGKPPAIKPPANDILEFCNRCGVKIPTNIRLQILDLD